MDKYARREKLGEDTYANVFKAEIIETGETVAIKYYRVEREEDRISPPVIRELTALQFLSAPNIIRLIEAFEDRGKFIAITEYLDVSLRKVIRHGHPGSPEFVQSAAYQLLAGLDYVHSHGFIHRKVEPSTLFVKDGILKIAKFEFVRRYYLPLSQYTPQSHGGIWYRAPELLVQKPVYGTAVDIWSAACVIYEAATGNTLFAGDSEIMQIASIFEVFGTPSDDEIDTFSSLSGFVRTMEKKPGIGIDAKLHSVTPELADLLKKMLVIDPAKRITAKEALTHPYFNTLNQNVKNYCAESQ